MLCLLAACKSRPNVELVASSCAEVTACTAECDRGVVVACDRLVALTPDPTARQAVYRKAYERWSQVRPRSTGGVPVRRKVVDRVTRR